jgi:NAD(P)-dependent dehydrogenase (short-subunit alcohol dehydrogenase family)
VVVVTGAGSGIGRALAQQFAEAGARLFPNSYPKLLSMLS